MTMEKEQKMQELNHVQMNQEMFHHHHDHVKCGVCSIERLGSSHFLFKASIARAWSSGRVWSFSCVFSFRRSGMPRRGWQTVEVPAGWFEVIRGVPSRRVGPRHSAKVQFALSQLVWQVVSRGSTFLHSQFRRTRGAPQKT